jgi:hypothetical protein
LLIFNEITAACCWKKCSGYTLCSKNAERCEKAKRRLRAPFGFSGVDKTLVRCLAGLLTPMVSDAAHALGAGLVLGARLSEAPKIFLLALAVVQDLGALRVMVIFHTTPTERRGDAPIAGLLLALRMAHRTGDRRGSIDGLLGLGL